MVELADCLEPVAADLDSLDAFLLQELSSDSAAIQDLVRHVAGYGGKRLRPGLVLLSARACGREITPVHLKLAVIVELIHTATLVHDDILDGASLRRRVPTVNALHGNQVSVLLGDFVYARAFAMSVELPTPAASRVLARVTQVVCRGEIEQIFDRFNLTLKESEYLRIIEAKTAELYSACCELGALYAGADAERIAALARYGRNIGIAFQVIDDCLDLIGDEAVVGKSLGTDLEGGKLTLPLIRLAQVLDGEERRRLHTLILDEGAQDRRARLLEEFDLGPALDYSFQRADAFIHRAMDELKGIEPSPARDALHNVAEFVLCRKR